MVDKNLRAVISIFGEEFAEGRLKILLCIQRERLAIGKLTFEVALMFLDDHVTIPYSVIHSPNYLMGWLLWGKMKEKVLYCIFPVIPERNMRYKSKEQ